jgi:hypothetical protein
LHKEYENKHNYCVEVESNLKKLVNNEISEKPNLKNEYMVEKAYFESRINDEMKCAFELEVDNFKAKISGLEIFFIIIIYYLIFFFSQMYLETITIL